MLSIMLPTYAIAVLLRSDEWKSIGESEKHALGRVADDGEFWYVILPNNLFMISCRLDQ